MTTKGSKGKKLMVLGTTSNAGKSVLVAALCRIYRNRGYKVAPFKAQNMALNSFITEDGLEMGRAQVMQAEAAGIAPEVDMNPILLKPTTDQKSQVIVGGKVYKNLSAKDYYREKEKLLPLAVEAFERLMEKNDIVFLEGAGSPSEINLKDVDIVNMGFAKAIDSDAILVGDIDRGGVFASLAGTMLLFDEEERERLKGVLINKFRGDVTILEPGLETLEEIMERPVLGVVPYFDLDLDDEDSLSDTLKEKRQGLVDIAVIRLPHISNFTDLHVFSLYEGVHVRYVERARELGTPDLLIIPGTKNTMDDLKWLRETGLDQKIMGLSRDHYVMGICGGYQMLGQKLSDPHGVEAGGSMEGLGLLPMETVFAKEKTTTQTGGKLLLGEGLFRNMEGMAIKGYEIHMGSTHWLREGGGEQALVEIGGHRDGGTSGKVYGSYLHGIFDGEGVSQQILANLMEEKGLDPSQVASFDLAAYKEEQYEKLAEIVAEALDLEELDRILGLEE
ncbi:MAG: cobyric acid synthase [Tissierellia bacterium]|nr:cobyric acid synthase [Tissierellia bacterium]